MMPLLFKQYKGIHFLVIKSYIFIAQNLADKEKNK